MAKTHKEIVLAIFIALFGVLTWFFLYRVLYFGEGTVFLVLTAIGVLLWGISICLTSLLINKKNILYFGFLLSLFSFFIFFHGSKAVPGQFREAFYYFIVLALIFIALIFYSKRVKYEADVRTKLNFWRIFRKGLSLVFTLLCILIALAYYFSPVLGDASKVEFKIPRSAFNIAIKPLGGLIQTRLPLYNPNMSVDELLTMFSFTDGGLSNFNFQPSSKLYNTIQSKGISIETLDFNKLLKDPEIAKLLQEEIKSQTRSLGAGQLAKQRAEFSKKLGIEIKGDEKLNDVLYKLINAQINNLGGPYRQYLPIVLAIVLFFALRIIITVLIPFVVLFSCFLIKILISLHFAKITIKPVETENIEL